MNPLGGVVGCPDENGDPTCPVGDFARAEYIGEGVAQIAIDALAGNGTGEGAIGPGVVVEDPATASLAIRRLPKVVPASNTVFLLAFKLGLLTRDAYTLDTTELVTAERLRDIPIEEFIGSLGIAAHRKRRRSRGRP